MENLNTMEKMPLNRDDFCDRYKISKITFWRWIKRAKIADDIPEIHQIKTFNIHQSKIIVNKFG